MTKATSAPLRGTAPDATLAVCRAVWPLLHPDTLFDECMLFHPSAKTLERAVRTALGAAAPSHPEGEPPVPLHGCPACGGTIAVRGECAWCLGNVGPSCGWMNEAFRDECHQIQLRVLAEQALRAAAPAPEREP